MEKSCLLLALLGFHEMCEDITSFMAGKGNVCCRAGE